MALSQDAFIYLAVSFFNFVFCYLAWQRRLVAGAWELCLLTMAAGFWAFTLFCESVVETVEMKLLWVTVSYTFVTTTPVFYLLFVRTFTGKMTLRHWSQRLFLFVVPVITIVLTWSNENHHLIWTGWDPLSSPHALLNVDRGLWFWIGVLFYSYLMLFLATRHLVVFLVKNRTVYGRFRTFVLLAGSMTPWLNSVLLVWWQNQPWSPLLMPFLVLLTGAVFTLGLFYAGFYNYLPVARELLVENLPDGILALDQLDRVQDINAKARRMVGLSASSSGPVNLDALKPSFRALGAALITPESGEMVQQGAGQAIKTYQLIKVPIKASSGCRIVIIRDVTEQKIAEKAILEAKEKAETSDRLKSAFLANMSHEIRTPMNSILGFVSLLLDEGVEEAEQRTYLGIVKQNSERLLGTLNDMLDISRIEAGQVTVSFSDFNVLDVLNNVAMLYGKQATDKHLQFIQHWEVPSAMVYVRTDKEKLFSILSNLVNNAVKFTAQGSVEFSCSLKANRLTVTVRDTGVGIPTDKQARVFERFVQGDTSHNRSYEGSGLGLAITKSYVDMLKGSISLESTIDKGSVFRVALPVKPAESLHQKA